MKLSELFGAEGETVEGGGGGLHIDGPHESAPHDSLFQSLWICGWVTGELCAFSKALI